MTRALLLHGRSAPALPDLCSSLRRLGRKASAAGLSRLDSPFKALVVYAGPAAWKWPAVPSFSCVHSTASKMLLNGQSSVGGPTQGDSFSGKLLAARRVPSRPEAFPGATAPGTGPFLLLAFHLQLHSLHSLLHWTSLPVVGCTDRERSLAAHCSCACAAQAPDTFPSKLEKPHQRFHGSVQSVLR